MNVAYRWLYLYHKKFTELLLLSVKLELLSVICTGCHCHSVSELLSGFAEASESTAKNIARDHDMPLLFPRGLLRLILDYLWPQLTKQTWKRHPSSLYALTWCVQQVQVLGFVKVVCISKKQL